LTPSGSLFRKQLVDCVLARLSGGTFAKSVTKYPTEFVQELAVAAMRRPAVKTWETVIGDNTKYLKPEEAKDNTT
jgi:hypothetical protein